MSNLTAAARITRAVKEASKTLDLSGLDLKALPRLPAELRDLQVLELGSNRLRELSADVAELGSLIRLGLGNNRFETLPTEIGRLGALIFLDLSENKLTTLHEDIADAGQLVELSLFGNRLTEVSSALFRLRRLERLDLSTNRLRSLPPVSGARSRLQVLDLSHNDLIALPEGLERLTALRILNVARNQLRSLDGIDALAMLEELDISDNALDSVPPSIAALSSLRRLGSFRAPLATLPGGRGASDNDALKAKAHAAVERLITGGPSEDTRYFDVVPFTFDFSLNVTGAGIEPLLDLYYKGHQGTGVALELPGGTQLALSNCTRTTALSIAHAHAADLVSTPARVRFGEAREREDMLAKSAFATDALTRVSGSSLAPKAEAEPATQFVEDESAVSEHEVRSSRNDHAAEPLERRVAVGIYPDDLSGQAIAETQPLPPDTWFWLWCKVETGTFIAGALGGGVALARSVPERADLDVAVFANPGGFELEHHVGTLRLAGGASSVLCPAGLPTLPDPTLISRCLFFRVKAPSQPGREQLRVHLYHRGLLVQALEISAWVGTTESCTDRIALKITPDYVLSHGLNETQLLSLGTHSLSIFANDSPGTRRGFRFFGADGDIVSDAVVETGQIANLLDKARRALRSASWGSDAPYDPKRDTYRYDKNVAQDYFKEDLVELAKCGFQLWDVLAQALSNDGDAKALRAAMRRPGIVQLGLKTSSTLMLPLAILYDHLIDPQLKGTEQFAICPVYLEAPERCLAGDCPNCDQSSIVCPSGFWGFRHSIGVPVGSASAPDAAGTVAAGKRRLVASAYAGHFPMRDSHLANVEKLVGVGSFEKKLTREGTVARMREGGFQLLYFYCHGGVDKDTPYVLVGPDNENPNRIARDTLRFGIEWNAPHALVFINGCYTTALEPEQAIDLVHGFVETAKASGVIGTEVTVFEPLATKMGESFLDSLLKGADVGTALRDARRGVLLGERPNPLGLVYIPFALATLKLEGL